MNEKGFDSHMNFEPKILLFAGAGASKAVAPELYPTTVEFFNDLPNSIKNNQLFARVEEFIKKTTNPGIIDIELILWRLQELKEFCSQSTDISQLPGWMFSGNRLASSLISNKQQNIGDFNQIATTAVGELNKLIDKINERVYKLYSKLPTSKQLQKNWTPLLDSLGKLGLKIDIVTTT